MKQYEVLDISGDAGIRAFAASVAGLFINTALGMYSLIADPETVQSVRHIEVSVSHASFDGLLISWLNELIYRFDVDGFLAGEIAVTTPPLVKEAFTENQDYSLKASLSGESFDPARHRGKLLLKAATYHNLKVQKRDGLWIAEVIFDI